MVTLKKTALIVIILVSGIFLYLSYDLERKHPSPIPLLPIPTVYTPHSTPTPVPVQSARSSIFIPYWALQQDTIVTVPYEKIYYFGVAVDKNAVVKNDEGYRGLDYIDCPDSKECILVVRMLNNEDNDVILKNTSLQGQAINNILALAKTYSFEGIALDLEQSTILNSDDTKDNISKFVQLFYTLAKKNYKSFSFIVYGDAYYRRRPYDMKALGQNSDEIMIMAYDFHKNYGEPGPNFPFGDFEKWGYDFRAMIYDFSSDVPKTKLTVIFGMYGYDWTLNAQGTPLKRASALTLNQIRRMEEQNGDMKTTALPSREKMKEYVDAEDQRHVIWYEDEDSVAVKEEYLMQQGIGSVSYWVYGYF